MARQGKAGLDYFSHDVDMMQDKKIRLIKAKHGLLGYAIYLRLLEELYRENGYYLQIDEDFNILFCGDNNIEFDVYINILNDCINKNLFCEKMYKKHNILTVERIQRNYVSGTERRKEVNFIKEYLLIKPREMYSDKVNVCIESLNVNINPLNDDIGTQKKREEIKRNKKTVQENAELVYKAYPETGAKKDCLELITKHLDSYSKEDLILCVERYTSETINKRKEFPELKYKNPKTFFNKAILNYTNEYWEEPKETTPTTFRTEEEKRYYMLLDMQKRTPEHVTDAEVEEKRLLMEESFKWIIIRSKWQIQK